MLQDFPYEVSEGRFAFCGTFPGSLPLGITQRPALRSPDFPLPQLRGSGRRPDSRGKSIHHFSRGQRELTPIAHPRW